MRIPAIADCARRPQRQSTRIRARLKLRGADVCLTQLAGDGVSFRLTLPYLEAMEALVQDHLNEWVHPTAARVHGQRERPRARIDGTANAEGAIGATLREVEFA